MKKIYLVFLLVLCSTTLLAQDTTDSYVSVPTDIPGFKLYPNPASGNSVYISTKDNLYKEIIIYNVFGKIVLADRITHNTLNISQLEPGVYVLQITENKKTMTRKLVVV